MAVKVLALSAVAILNPIGRRAICFDNANELFQLRAGFGIL